ncbi:MAG: DUF2244 domain-containing protein [Azospirillum sp.]|nr:DUF2244 domain-containing protein [Azospirillum sp.]
MTSVSDTASAGPPRILFDAVLHPHRSLGSTGFTVLMVGFGGISLVAGLYFLSVGAWPVFGFFGLDAAILWLAFRRNYRDGARYETVRLTDHTLTVWRIEPRDQPRSWTFQPGWLRVNMDDPPRHDSQVMLSSHGRSLVIGAFLAPAERLEFAKALRAALTEWRGGRG